MKLLYFFLILFLIWSNLHGQSYNAEINGKEQIIEVDSLKAQEIQSKIMAWIALNYKSANDVLQFSSKDKIIAKGNFSVSSNVPFPGLLSNEVVYVPANIAFNHTLIVSIRDYRCKVDISFPETVKTVTYLDRDWFFNIDEVVLMNDFTIEKQYERAEENLNIQHKNNEKKVKRKLNKLKKYLNANFAYEKEVATAINNKIEAIVNSLNDYLNKKSDDW